jgi:hypothetical protein
MSLLKIKKIEFDSPLQIIGHDKNTVDEKIEYIYRFYLTTSTRVLIGRSYDTHYICFYCFKPGNLKDVRLENKIMQKIIEGEMFNIEGYKFISEDASSCPYVLTYPMYGACDNFYEKDSYTGVWRKDEYFEKWDAINAFYKFDPYTLRYVVLELGKLFYWQNKKNISIVLPEFPYNLIKK